MKAILITFFYHPEAGAPQSRLASQTKVMLDRGHYVDVLTTMPNYPIGKPFSGYAGRIFMAEKNGDNFIYRVWSLGITNLRPFWRILKYLTFLMASIFALFALRAKGKRYDCILVESPPLFTCIVGVAAKALWRAPLVTQVSDLWVDLLPEFGILRSDSTVFRLILKLEQMLLSASAHIITVTRGCQDALSAKVRGRAPVSLVMNGADLSIYRADAINRSVIREQRGWDGKVICVYAGNLGYIHGLDAMVDAAEMIQDDERIRFVVIGDGVFKSRLMALIDEKKLANMDVLPSVAESDLSGLLQSSDIGLVFLNASVRALDAVSVKTFSYMASGMPVSGCCAGTTKDIIEQSGCGILASPGCGKELAKVLRDLAENPAIRAKMGSCGREAVRRYDRMELGRQFVNIVENTVTASQGSH
jgi:glycosyltransferase involved in cell wall biosynthesis